MFTLVVTKVIQQIILLTILPLNSMLSRVSYFNLKHTKSISKRLADLVQLYTPVRAVLASKQLDNSHSFFLNFVKNYAVLIVFIVLVF